MRKNRVFHPSPPALIPSVNSTSDVQVERISSLAQISELAHEWDRVQRQCSDKHVLMDHRWLCTWLKIFGSGKEPCILVLREQGSVVGIAPLIISRGYELFPSRNFQVHMADEYRFTRVPRLVRLLPIRRLTFALSGALANRRSHFLFVEQDRRFYERTLSYLDSIAHEWDLMVLEGLPEGSQQEELLLSAIDRSHLRGDGRRFSRETMFAKLPDSMDLYLASKTRHFRKRLAEQCRQAEKRFPELRIREFRGSRIDQGMEKLLELEKRSWKTSGARKRTFYIGPEPQLQAFHREAARAFAETDGAVVLTMEIAGRPVAGIHCLERDGVTAAIITFLDAEFSSKLNTAPMFRYLIKSSIERGLREIDFNGKTANIAKWAEGIRRSSRFFFYNRRPYSRFLRLLSSTAHGAYRAVSAVRRNRENCDGSST